MNFWLRIAAILTLVALALMMWSLLQPTPLPVMIAMSVGQALGTAAFAAYGFVVYRDITRQRAEKRSARLAEASLRMAAQRDSKQKLEAAPAKARDSQEKREARDAEDKPAASDPEEQPAARDSSEKLEPPTEDAS